MQDTKGIDLRQIEKVVKDKNGKIIVISNTKRQEDETENDSGTALQHFLNHIPINSIPGLKNSPVLELKTEDSLRDAIHILYEKNKFGAPILDVMDTNATTQRISDRYMGFVDFATMVLWSLEELTKCQKKDGDSDDSVKMGFFTMLEQIPQIGQTKIGELAKSFKWDPYLPAHWNDTLFQTLLMISKHQLQVVPVVEEENSPVIGFVTQSAVNHLLLQSDGLEWFDRIADKPLSEFGFGDEAHFSQVYGDECVEKALCLLSRHKIFVVIVTDRKNHRLLGYIRRSDVYHFVEKDHLLHKRMSITAEEFIHTKTKNSDSNTSIEQDTGALPTAGTIPLRNFLPRMDSPTITKKTDTLKHVMKKLAETNCDLSFLLNDSGQVTGVLTLRDIIIQFSPPGIDSTFHGGGFFESALEQGGCQVKNGTIISNH